MKVEMDNYCPSHPEMMASAFRSIASLEIPSLKQERQNPRDPCVCCCLHRVDECEDKERKKLCLWRDAYDPSWFWYFFSYIFTFVLDLLWSLSVFFSFLTSGPFPLMQWAFTAHVPDGKPPLLTGGDSTKARHHGDHSRVKETREISKEPQVLW